MKQVKKLSVVGGGTAGFVAALILKQRFPQMDIELIRSKKIGIIGVGEGSTEHWNEFLTYIGVKWQAVIQHCNATFKCGIMFRGWHDQDYMHSIGPENDVKNGQYPTIYGKYIAEGAANRFFNPNLTWDNKLYANFPGRFMNSRSSSTRLPEAILRTRPFTGPARSISRTPTLRKRSGFISG